MMSLDAAALQRHFGFTTLRPGQAEAIAHVLAGRDTLVVMPTGAGKSLIYQLPALVSSGTTLVISPLVALMKDQVDSLVAAGHAATYINSSLPGDEQGLRVERMARGDYRLVYVAPERLRNRPFLRALERVTIDRIAVDEAHCISQWGHDFRPDYLTLGRLIEQLGRPPVVALTATATPQVQDDIIAQLGMRDATRIVTGFNRPNLSFEVRPTPDDAAKLRDLRDLLDSVPGTAIVYAATRKEAEQVHAYLVGLGEKSTFYHAGLNAETRRQAQDAFMGGAARVIVATNAFGMGVDKPDIRLVVHYSLPSTVEAYYQEAGRAGRDGAPARCILLYAAKDRALQEWFIDNDAPTPQELRGLLAWLQKVARDGVARVSDFDLARHSRLNEVKLRVGLSQLQRNGAITHLGDEQGWMRFEVQSPGADIDLTETAAQVEQRRAAKRDKLAEMVRYAELKACRRRFILVYFGDPGAPEAERCCDVCLGETEADSAPTRQAQSTAEWTLLIILEAVRSLTNNVGRARLAQMLKGSRSATLGALTRHRLYGKLGHLSQPRLEEMIDGLADAGYLRLVGSDSPTLALTPRGSSALRAKAAIELPHAHIKT